VLYLEELIGPDVINTMPLKTLRAFAEHGEVARTVDADPKSDARVLTEAARDGVDLERLTAELEREGVRSFRDAYQKLLDCIASRSEQMGVG
jgi:transaldolase